VNIAAQNIIENFKNKLQGDFLLHRIPITGVNYRKKS
jgi:hypothetical protein